MFFQNDSYFRSGPSRSGRPESDIEEDDQERMDAGDPGDDQMGHYSAGEDYISE